MNPLVSVVIPTFNRADTLPRALDSVIAQTYPEWEIVLIDDGSTDATPRIAEAYAVQWPDRFIYRRQDNRGACRARNHGIDVSRGAFVAFLDADDAFAPTKLQRQLELFHDCPDLGLVFSDYACVDLHGERLESAFDRFYPQVRALPTTEVAPRQHVCTGSIFEALLRGYFIATIVGMVRREVLSDRLRFAEHLPYAHEWLFYVQVCRGCRVGYVDEPLSIHYFTPGSLTRTDPRKNLEHLYALLREMSVTLAPRKWRHRRIIAGHCAETSRSLGSLAYRRGAFAEAARWFLRALGHAGRPRDVYDVLDASCRWLRRFGRKTTSTHQA